MNLFVGVKRVKARSTALTGAKRIQNVKTNLTLRRKKSHASVVYSLRTYFIHPTLWFHPRKKFWTVQILLNGRTLRRLRCQSVTYTGNKRSMSVIIRWTSAVTFFCFLLASSKLSSAALKTERGRKNMVHGTSILCL